MNTNIEVTSDTFFKLFENVKPTSFNKKETHEITIYHNDKIQQRGVKIYNFASSQTSQYYLTDINA